MSNVASSPPSAPEELIAKLIRAGYLQPGLGNDPVAVAKAIARLKQNLRSGGQEGEGLVAEKANSNGDPAAGSLS